MKMKITQLDNGLATALLLAVLAPLCAAQAITEGAQLSNAAKPPIAAAAPTAPGAASAATVPPVDQAEPLPMSTPPPSAGPIQASISGGAAVPGSFSAISRVPAESNMLHIVVGHQVFINTKSRLRKIIITDPAVLSSNTLTANQIVLTATGPGITSLTLLDEIGRAQSYMISSDLDLTSLRTALAAALSHDQIDVEENAGRVMLTGSVPTQADSDAAAKLAGLYAKDVVNALVVAPGHPRQVRLQVRILEVDRAKAVQYGINLFSPGGNSTYMAATTTTQYPSTATATGSAGVGQSLQVLASNPLNFFLYSARANIGATLQDLQTKQVLQILAEPTITTISGEKADFLSGGEFPVPMAQPGGGGAAPVITVTFRPFGVKVEFTPIVNPDGTIRLTVSPEVSALDYGNAVSISGFTIPAISTRRASTQVELRSDQSFAISGLLDQRTSDLFDKNPGIASIPILGDLFKSKNSNHQATELVVVVTPSVVDPLTDSPPVAQPDLPVPTLDRPGFDKSLGKNLNPRPEAPSLDPNRPPYGDAVPAPLLPDPNSPDGKIVGDALTPKKNEFQTAPQPAQSTLLPKQAMPATAIQQEKVTPPGAPASRTAAPIQTPVPSVVPATPAAQPTQQQAAPASPAIASAAAPVSQPARPSGAVTSATLVEIMALSHESDADATVSALRRHGYNPSINRSAQDSLVHLDLGPFPSRGEAEAMRQRLVQDGYDASLK